MENSLLNKIAVWRHEEHPHKIGLEILDELIQMRIVKSSLRIVLEYNSPYTKRKMKDLFSDLEKSIKPKKRKSLPSPDLLPDDLKVKLDIVKMNYSSITTLRGKLSEIFYTQRGSLRRNPNHKLSQSIAFQIQEMGDENRDLLFEIDYFIEHKKRLDKKTTYKMPDMKRAAYLLSEQVGAINYIRKQDTNRKKTGSLQNPALYRERKELLLEIKKFIDEYGN